MHANMGHIPSFEEVSNVVDLPADLENCSRTGCMAAFQQFDEFIEHFDDIMCIFDGTRPSTPDTLDDMGSDNDESDMNLLSQSVTISHSFSDATFMGSYQESKVLPFNFFIVLTKL